MNAWEAIQVRSVDSIVAEVFAQMDGRSDSDPTSPWADLALALCERIKTSEAGWEARFRAEVAKRGWCIPQPVEEALRNMRAAP